MKQSDTLFQYNYGINRLILKSHKAFMDKNYFLYFKLGTKKYFYPTTFWYNKYIGKK